MSLKSKVLEGIKWRGIVDVSQQLLQILFTIILARLLTKADFGLVAMALLVNRFAIAITNIGFGSAIIQSQSVTKGQISAIFYIQLSLNIVLTSLVFLGSGLAAEFFEEPQLIPIIQTLSVVIFLQTFQFPVILLRKSMDFKKFSIAELVSMISSNIIAIIMAFIGFGVWSLVWRLILQRIIFGTLTFSFGKWLPSKPQFKGIRPLFNFGLNMFGSKLLSYFSENIIAILTGKFLGKEVLGVFNIAFNLAIKPSSKVQSILTSVLTPAFSKIQFEKEKFARNSLNVLRITSLFFLPIMIMLAATSTNLIVTLYGSKWYNAGNMLLLLSVVGILRGLSHLIRNAIVSKGDSRAVFHEKIIGILLSLPIMYVLMPQYGIYGLIAGYFLGALSAWIFLSRKYNQCINQRYGVLKAIASSAAKSLVLFVAVYSINFLELKFSLALILQLITGLLIFATMLWLFNKTELMAVVNKLKKPKKPIHS